MRQFVVLLTFCCLMVSTHAAETTYNAQLAAARQFAAEGSWAKARDAYTAALKLAPDNQSRERCTLGRVDATWRAADASRSWDEQTKANLKLHHTVFTQLLSPYNETRPRDDFWVEIMKSRSGCDQKYSSRSPPWATWLEIADYLAEQPRTNENATIYANYLKQTIGPDWLLNQGESRWDLARCDNPAQRQRLINHLKKASDLSLPPCDRAWFALFAAELHQRWNSESLDDSAALFKTTLSLAKGTSHESLARASEFVWRAKNNRLQLDNQCLPAIPAWLSELQSISTLIEQTTTSELLSFTATELEQLRSQWSKPKVDLYIDSLFRPDEPVLFTYGGTYTTQLTFDLYRVAPDDGETAFARGPRNESRTPEGSEKILSWAAKPRDPGVPVHVWKTGVEKVPETLASGIYALVVRTESITQQTRIFTVSRSEGVAINTAKDRIEFYCYDSKTKQPITQAKVQGWTFDHQDQPQPSFSLKTDADGRVSWSNPKKFVDRAIIVIEGTDPVLFKRCYFQLYDHRRLLLDVFLDRKLYRPGETVHWKLIARDRANGRFTAPRKGLTMKVTLDSEELVRPVELTWSPNGTATGELTIPPSARPGAARLSLQNGKDYVAGAEFFTVDNFATPPVVAELDFTGSPNALRNGGAVTFQVKARYFSGGPVIGAPVEFRYAAMAAGPIEDKATADAYYEEWQAGDPRKLLTGITDTNGIATFRFDLPNLPTHRSKLGCGFVIKPVGMPTASGTKTLWMTDSGLRLDLLNTDFEKILRPGETATIAFKAIDGLDRPTPFSGEASLVEIHWQEVWLDPQGNLVTGAALAVFRRENNLSPAKDLPKDWKKIHSATSEIIISNTSVTSAKDGLASVSFAIPRPGIYEVRVKSDRGRLYPKGSDDSEGSPLKFYAFNETTTEVSIPPNDILLIGPGRIGPNEKPRFLVALPEGKTQALLCVSGEGETRTQPIQTKGRLALVTFENPPFFSNTGTAQIITSDENNYNNYRKSSCTFKVVDPKQTVTCEIFPSAEISRPGDSASALVRTFDAQRNPVTAEVAFAASDEAVNQRLDDSRGKTPRFFNHNEQHYFHLCWSEIWNAKKTVYLIRDPRPGTEQSKPIEIFSIANANDTISFGDYKVGVNRGAFASIPMSTGPVATKGLSEVDDAIQIRRHFVPTACWEPSIITDAKGEARVTFKYPDNLTQWRLSAYAVGEDLNSFGTATAFTRTSLPFQARLQLPRFLVAGDTAFASAVLVNRSDADLTASAKLIVKGAVSADPKSAQRDAITVSKQNEAHAAWEVKADQPGTATFILASRAGAESDAMELPLPVLEDGIAQNTATSTRLAADARKCSFTLPLPKPLDPARTHVTVQLNAGYASTLLDALPYLVDYPYGCVEQTTSRFLPAVAVRNVLKTLGLPADVVDNRIRANESDVDATRRSKTAGLSKLENVIAQSLARLTEAQINHRTGNSGFGWWPGAHQPDLWMTAYVVWSLAQAKAAGISIPQNLIEEATVPLIEMIGPNAPDKNLAVWGLVAALQSKFIPKNTDPAVFTRVFDSIYPQRDTLSASGRSCLVLAAQLLNRSAELAVLLRNLENGATRVKSADHGDTVHWGSTSGYWRAMDGAVESTALTLLALLETDPKHPLVEPAINWLLLNRRSAHWSNTRDTAFALLALARGLELRGDSQLDTELELLANGSPIQRIKFTRETLLLPSTAITIPTAHLKPGQTSFTLRRLSGKASIYAVAHSTAWARSDTIRPSGHLIELDRTLTRQKAQPTLIGTLRITPEPMPTGSTAMTGEQVTAVITLNVPSDLEYVMVEVPKPAGCEPLNPLSGWDARIERVDDTPPDITIKKIQNSDTGRPVYREEHDAKSVFFLDRLSAGKWQIRFGLRAVTPGNFRVLPAQVQAMYAPEVTANTDALRVLIKPTE